MTNKYQNEYGVAIHIPLNRIIKDFSVLDKKEVKFAQNEWSHVDFLIYNKLNKSPVLAIEVDGATYHKADSRQAMRDKLKNAIFEKYSLPLIRFGTKDNVTSRSVSEKIIEHLH